MYKKILSFLLLVCLCVGVLPGGSAQAMEGQGDTEKTVFVAEGSEAGRQDARGEEEAELPQNGSKVYVEDGGAQSAATAGG